MATAKKQASGNWRIKVYDNSLKKQVAFTAGTKKECELLAAQYLADQRRPPAQLTLQEAVDKYIEMKSNVLSPSTIAGYQQIERNWLGGLKVIRLCDISNTTLQTHINQLSLNHSAKSVYNTYGLISAVFKAFSPGSQFNIKLPPKKKRTVIFPEIDAILNAFKGTDVELPVLLALWLGMRMSEIRGATKSNINDGVLTIDATVLTVNGKQIHRQNTKTFDSTRNLVLPAYIQQLIAQLPPEQERLTILSGDTIYRHYSNILEKNNLPHIRFHDLRHLNASLMLSLGISDKIAMERGGWSNPTIMKSVYQHIFDADRQKADAIIDSYFDKILQ